MLPNEEWAAAAAEEVEEWLRYSISRAEDVISEKPLQEHLWKKRLQGRGKRQEDHRGLRCRTASQPVKRVLRGWPNTRCTTGYMLSTGDFRTNICWRVKQLIASIFAVTGDVPLPAAGSL